MDLLSDIPLAEIISPVFLMSRGTSVMWGLPPQPTFLNAIWRLRSTSILSIPMMRKSRWWLPERSIHGAPITLKPDRVKTTFMCLPITAIRFQAIMSAVLSSRCCSMNEMNKHIWFFLFWWMYEFVIPHAQCFRSVGNSLLEKKQIV